MDESFSKTIYPGAKLLVDACLSSKNEMRTDDLALLYFVYHLCGASLVKGEDFQFRRDMFELFVEPLQSFRTAGELRDEGHWGRDE